MVDLVYVIGNKSRFDNNELKYALRSVEKYCTNFNNVYIVGYKPDFLNDNVKFVYCPDMHKDKHKNIMDCLIKVVQNRHLLRYFIRMADDEFYVRPTNMDSIPIYIKGSLPVTIEDNDPHYEYDCVLKDTRNLLDNHDLPLFNTSQHTGTLFDKTVFKNNIDLFEEAQNTQYGCEPTCIMSNLLIDSVKCNIQKRDDLKLYRFSNEATLRKTIGDRNCFSISDSAAYYGIFDILEKWFPEKSRYEL